MTTIDVEVFGSILCEQCLNLGLCADIAAARLEHVIANHVSVRMAR